VLGSIKERFETIYLKHKLNSNLDYSLLETELKNSLSFDNNVNLFSLFDDFLEYKKPMISKNSYETYLIAKKYFQKHIFKRLSVF
jgi:hypothetical protein